MISNFQTFILSILLVAYVGCECPFARLDNPGFACNANVTNNSSFLDQLVENIHNNNTPTSCLIDKVSCDENSPFSPITGICNNLVNPLQGVTMSLFGRKLANAYNDSSSQPRIYGENGEVLPNPRLVSTTVNYLVSSNEGKSKDHIHLLPLFGQWLGHDLVYTSLVPALAECMECDTTHEDCMPIAALDNKTDSPFKTGCMQFTRSADGNSGKGERKQINQVSSAMDASTLYGSDIVTYEALREYSGGRMKTQTGGILPQLEANSEGIGCSPLSTEPCFQAGDDRNGQTIGLNAMHVLWVQEHNRIADYFAENTNWDNDQIFLKTRQLIQAMIQHITFEEYLPVLLDNDTMTTYGLNEETGTSHFTGYDSSCDITPDTEFATAAYRFGHSAVHYRLDYEDKDGNDVHHGMKHNWHFVFVVHQAALLISESDFTRTPRLDLNALNIQRGRDHGIKGYNHYREAYGFTALTDYEDLYNETADRNTTDSIKAVYDHVNDMDLFTGISIENEAPEGTKYGILGDVGKHMVGEHFEKLKKCDRFFYSGDSSTNKGSFTGEQLNEIRKIGLANVICEHLDQEVEISSENPFVEDDKTACKNFIKIDLNFFLDSTYAGWPSSNVTSGMRLTDIDDTIHQLRQIKPASQEICDRVCRQESDCLAFDYQESSLNCLLFKDLSGTTYASNINWVHGVPDRSDPDFTADTFVEHTPSWKEIDIGTPLCLLEIAGNEDIGAKFL